MNSEKEIARALLEIGAVGFKPQEPVTFKSGIKSPVYVDNRRFPYFPAEWHLVIGGFKDLVEKNNLVFDVLAGIAVGGIPHSAALGYEINKPSVFVRKEVKGHGLGKRVEGGIVEGKKVLLVEDLITTGSSSLSGITALRDEGAVVTDCLVIVSYGFKETVKAFTEANVRMLPLTSFPIILEEALALGKFNSDDKMLIEDWFADPHGWGKRHNFE